MLFLNVTTKKKEKKKKKKEKRKKSTANRMLRNCLEDIQFCYYIRGKSYDKYDPCYAVLRR